MPAPADDLRFHFLLPAPFKTESVRDRGFHPLEGGVKLVTRRVFRFENSGPDLRLGAPGHMHADCRQQNNGQPGERSFDAHTKGGKANHKTTMDMSQINAAVSAPTSARTSLVHKGSRVKNGDATQQQKPKIMSGHAKRRPKNEVSQLFGGWLEKHAMAKTAGTINAPNAKTIQGQRSCRISGRPGCAASAGLRGLGAWLILENI